jgi:curved DNA-binding protein CbpA
VRARITARRALVEDGDYFAILGVPRDSTGYEIKRAYLDLRRALDPSKVMRPSLLDVADDLKLVLGVLDEAYDVLKDATRRERYRRAITHEPPAR